MENSTRQISQNDPDVSSSQPNNNVVPAQEQQANQPSIQWQQMPGISVQPGFFDVLQSQLRVFRAPEEMQQYTYNYYNMDNYYKTSAFFEKREKYSLDKLRSIWENYLQVFKQQMINDPTLPQEDQTLLAEMEKREWNRWRKEQMKISKEIIELEKEFKKDQEKYKQASERERLAQFSTYPLKIAMIQESIDKSHNLIGINLLHIQEIISTKIISTKIKIDDVLKKEYQKIDEPKSFFQNLASYITTILDDKRCEEIINIFDRIKIIDNERKERGENAQYTDLQKEELSLLQKKLENEVKKYDKKSAEILYSLISTEANVVVKEEIKNGKVIQITDNRSLIEKFKNVPNEKAGWNSADIILNSLKEKYPTIDKISSFSTRRKSTLTELWSDVVEKIIVDEKTNWNDEKNRAPLFKDNEINKDVDKIISTYHISDVINAIDEVQEISNIKKDDVIKKLNNRLNDLFKKLPAEQQNEVMEAIKNDADLPNFPSVQLQNTINKSKNQPTKKISYPKPFVDFEEVIESIKNSERIDNELKLDMIANYIKDYIEEQEESRKDQTQVETNSLLTERSSDVKVYFVEKLFNNSLSLLNKPEEKSAFADKVFSDLVAEDNQIAKKAMNRILNNKTQTIQK